MEQEVKEIHNRNEQESVKEGSEKKSLPDFYLSDEQLEELQEFCQNFNPYEEPSLEDKLRLQEYGVSDLNNPFEVTNKILLLLENNIQFRENSAEAR